MKLKILKKKYQYLIIVPAVLITSNVSFAEDDIQVVTNLSVDITSFDIKINETFNNSGNPTWDGSTETRSISTESASSTLGVNVLIGDFNFGLTALITGSEPAVIEGTTVLANGSTTSNSVNAAISRTSYNILAGYRFSDSWSAYGGYILASTQVGDTFTFDDNGFFLGAKYILRTGASSSLTFNAAYSLTDSSIDLQNNSLLNNYRIEGDADAISLGVTWLYSLDRGRSFYIRLKHSILELDGTQSGVSPAIGASGDVNVTSEQTYTTFSLGMGF